jgi:hypothetical protein
MQLTLLSMPRRRRLKAIDVTIAEQKEKIEKAIADLKNVQTGGDIYEIDGSRRKHCRIPSTNSRLHAAQGQLEEQRL